MRVVLGLILGGLILWTGLWFLAAGRIEDGTEAWLAGRAADGYDVRYEAIDVSGYPYRFDLHLTEPEIAAPDGRLAWRAPEARVQALAYTPTHLIATLPAQQALTLGDTTFDIRSDRMQASLRTGLSTALPLERMTAEADGLILAADAGWGLAAEKVVLATRTSEMTGASPYAHDVVLTAAAFTPDAALRAQIDPNGRMAPVIGPLKLDATVTLDAPVDRAVFEPEARLPELTRLDLRDGTLVWGEAKVALSGSLDFGPAGLANGTLRLSVAGWADILRLAASLGLVPEGQRRTVEQGMKFLEATRFGAKALDLTLPVREGVVLLGPLPIGHLPAALRQP